MDELSYAPTPTNDPYSSDWSSLLTGALNRVLDVAEYKSLSDLANRPLPEENKLHVRGDSATTPAGKPAGFQVPQWAVYVGLGVLAVIVWKAVA